MARSQVFPDTDGCEAMMQEAYGLSADDIENPAILYSNAYKVKQHTAIPEAGFSTAIEFADDPQPGWNWYYLRISQLNGQYAWSSPIWVEA
jgi:hypothetical protein